MNGADPASSGSYLDRMSEIARVAKNRVSGVNTVLVVLSSAGMVFDRDAIRQKVTLAYPEAAIFFATTKGKPLGIASPNRVDLLIDLTGPGQRQPWFHSRRLRRKARFAVGRRAGFFRHRIYDRVHLEGSRKGDVLDWERAVQKEVFALAGVAVVPTADVPPDLGKTIALELPPMTRL